MIGQEMTYAVFTDSHSVIQLIDHELQFLLQVVPAVLLLRRIHRQSKDPFLEDPPHGGTSASELYQRQFTSLLICGFLSDSRGAVGRSWIAG